MKLYAQNANYTLYNGDVLELNEVIQDSSVDVIITDPPYELNFMGKTWDNSGIAFNVETWKKCNAALKDGGYLIAFGGSRTFHRMACAIEDADFEIRDVIMWIYGSGFPKSIDIGLAIDKHNGVDNSTGVIKKDGKVTNGNIYNCAINGSLNKEYEKRVATNEWGGWGTSLKPSYEPIIIARKKIKGTLINNVLVNGVGAINIDACRIPTGEDLARINKGDEGMFVVGTGSNKAAQLKEQGEKYGGRFPSNVILTYDETDYDEVCGGFPNTKGGTKNTNVSIRKAQKDNCYQLGFTKKENSGQYAPNNYGDSGSAARYFYCAKASKKDRDEGLDDLPRKNIHTTVKPTELMQYLIRMFAPKGAVILDCFNGSGSTGKAAAYENLERGANYKYIGVDLNEEYLAISKARIEYVMNV